MHQSILLRNFIFIGLLITFILSDLHAQPFRYLVLFKDKAGTSYSINSPEAFLSTKAIERRRRQGIDVSEKDLPVSQIYLDSLQNAGIKVLYTSKWLNGVLLEFDSEEKVAQLNGFTFVRKHNFNFGVLSPSEISPTETSPIFSNQVSFRSVKSDSIDYGNAFEQLDMLGIPAMHKAGYTGKGIVIAVFDSGFRNADRINAFDSIQTNGLLIDTYDFVEREENVFDDHDHGTKVLSIMASKIPGSLVGAAYEASYVLLRSEEVANESRLEEFYWLLAAEYSDSLGVDIINSSLGYNIFDNDIDNYTQNDLDGGTALITIAADLAASTGMLVVSSAGNEGNSSWSTLTPPADADSILVVGAVTALGNFAGFSSVGPTADGRIKPDVVARGTSVAVSSSGGRTTFSNGTSFSAPLISGLAAGIWQAYPDLTNMELINKIRLIASQSEMADNQVGFGVPDFKKLLPQVSLEDTLLSEKVAVFPNPSQGVFTMVLPQEFSGNEIKVNIYTSSGQLFHSFTKVVKQNELKIDFLITQGLFFVHLQGKEFSVMKKVIIN